MTPLDRLEWLAAVAADRDLPDPCIRAANVIADRVHQDGRAIVGLAGLASALGVHKDTAKRMVKALEKAGWLHVKPGRGRGKATSYYPLDRPKINGKRVHQPRTLLEPESEPAQSPEKGAQKGAQKGATVAPLHGDPWDLSTPPRHAAPNEGARANAPETWAGSKFPH